MRIGLISCEYAGKSYNGGIGTYVRNAARMLAERGHDVEVFAGSEIAAQETDERGVRLNCVAVGRHREEFGEEIVPLFLSRHRDKPFDVIEGPDFCAESLAVARAAPDVPHVLKLHTPGVLIGQIDGQLTPLATKARWVLGSLRKGKRPKPYWRYDASTDIERSVLETVDEIVAPSQGIVRRMSEIWPLREVAVVPNVFYPPPALLEIDPDTSHERVTYLGRLELRKGVLDLARAIPLVLKERPNIKFRFVGRTLKIPATNIEIRAKIKQDLTRYSRNLEFVDGVPYTEIPAHLAASDICVFPSIWENFPNACLEAMAAARGVIGSSAGGMAEIIGHGRTGLLVPPRNPEAIARAILELLADRQRRSAMGQAAREHILRAYAPDAIGPLQEASYSQAIATCSTTR